MRVWGAACLVVMCCLIGLQPLAAQSPNPPPSGLPDPAAAPDAQIPRGAVVVVMESAGGVRAASTLRTALTGQAKVRVLSVADVARNKAEPSAVLMVSAVASREVSVSYWDAAGGRDSLSSPAPARADQIDAVVLALASALLSRHRPELLSAKREPTLLGSRDFARTTDELYAVLGRYARLHPRSNVALRFEDF